MHFADNMHTVDCSPKGEFRNAPRPNAENDPNFCILPCG